MLMNWKTTLGGSLTGTGTMLMGAGALGWMPEKHKVLTMYAGFIMMAAGSFFTGLFARDRNVTSSEMGLPISEKQLAESLDKADVIAEKTKEVKP